MGRHVRGMMIKEKEAEMAKKIHPGFKAVQTKISQEENIPMANAAAILAKATRKASPISKKANPKLKKVRGR